MKWDTTRKGAAGEGGGGGVVLVSYIPLLFGLNNPYRINSNYKN